MSYAVKSKEILNEYISAVDAWVKMFCSNVVNEATGASAIISNDLLELRRVRWHAIRNHVDLENLFIRYINNAAYPEEVRETIADFYIGGTTYMKTNVAVSSQDETWFIDHLASSITWPQRSAHIPELIKGNSANHSEMGDILKTTPWFLFMFILNIGVNN